MCEKNKRVLILALHFSGGTAQRFVCLSKEQLFKLISKLKQPITFSKKILLIERQKVHFTYQYKGGHRYEIHCHEICKASPPQRIAENTGSFDVTSFGCACLHSTSLWMF